MDFFIRQHSEQPILLMELTQDSDVDYKKFYQLLKSATITFSMRDKNGRLKVANKEAGIVKKPVKGTPSSIHEEYYIYYKFSNKDTDTVGLFEGQFLIEFHGNESPFIGQFRAPVEENLNIYVRESFTKSEPIYANCDPR